MSIYVVDQVENGPGGLASNAFKAFSDEKKAIAYAREKVSDVLKILRSSGNDFTYENNEDHWHISTTGGDSILIGVIETELE